jgi:hypothetical protein
MTDVICYIRVLEMLLIQYFPRFVHQEQIGAFEMQVYSKVKWIYSVPTSFAKLVDMTLLVWH